MPGIVLAAQGDCAQPVSTGTAPTVRDCLYVLQVSVSGGSSSCDTPCICDADGDRAISATDALLCMRKAVGIHDVGLCNLCAEPLPQLEVITRGVADIPQDAYGICPTELGFSILLAADGRGWVSLEGPTIDANIFPVAWEQAGADIDIAAGSPQVSGVFQYDPFYLVDVGWRDLMITVTDTDADGVVDSGTANVTITCDYSDSLFDLNDATAVSFGLAPDPSQSTLHFTADPGLQPLFTFADIVSVRATRPVLRDTLATVTLLADGVPHAASVSIFEERGPFAAGVKFDPVDPIPFGASLTIDPGTAADVYGREAIFDGVALQTIEDPGPLSTNSSFETSGGWIGLQTFSVPSFLPVDGQTYAYVFNGQELLGYLDVPSDATTLRFWAGVHEYLDYCPFDASVTITTPNETFEVFPPANPVIEPCDDCVLAELIPWTEVVVDLQSLRGQRIIVRAEPSTFTHCAPDLYEEPVLDDFRIE